MLGVEGELRLPEANLPLHGGCLALSGLSRISGVKKQPLFADMFQNVPLVFQLSWIVLVGLFVWAFSVAHEPRKWRRLYQSMFSRQEHFSVNKNKVIDENLRKYGIIIAMVFLVAFVASFVAGLTYWDRKEESLSNEDRDRINEQRRIQGTSSGRGGL